MRILIYSAATALVLLLSPALAGDKITIDPNEITVDAKRPPLQLNGRQRAAIQDALETENTEQETPDKFEAKIGETLPLMMTVDAMPEPLIQREPSLKQYGYAKIAKDVLVVDPMKKTIIAVLPRKSPPTGKAQAPVDWAATRGRELTGQAPEPTQESAPAHEPAGDSGDKKNGNEAATKENSR
ncbi:MAG TPA: hypothetical protein VKP52_11600 [Pseudolabrys sp.]|nr:hypothetical protein [Pseudolabrys sp.]